MGQTTYFMRLDFPIMTARKLIDLTHREREGDPPLRKSELQT